MLFEVFSVFSSGGHFVQRSGTVWVSLVEDLLRNNLLFGWICPVVTEETLFEVFSSFSSGGHFLKWCRTIWAILVEDLPRNNPIMFGWNLPSGNRGDVWIFFYFYLWQSLCAVEQNDLSSLVENLPRNNPINFGWNLPSSYRGDVIWSKLWTPDTGQSQ